MKRFAFSICCLSALLISQIAFGQAKYPQQWNMIGADLSSDAGMNRLIAMLKQSKDCGCTHVMMDEGGWMRNADNPEYLTRVANVKAAAAEMKINIVPTVYAFAVATKYLRVDPDLSASLPVKDMPFVVTGRTAVPDPAGVLDLSDLMAKPEAGTTYAKHFKVSPFMYYKVTLRTTLKPEDREAFRASTMDNLRWLTRADQVSQQVGDEWVTTNIFNTLDGQDLRFRVTLKDPKIFKSVKVELAGPLLILRRQMTPLTVTSEDGQTAYEEGKDFKKLVDPTIAAGSTTYAWDHKPANIELTDNSRIKDGQKLKVSFFHAAKCFNKANMTMEDPAVYPIMEQDVNNCVKVWNPTGFFMHFDEIRIGGWETPSIPPGGIVADMCQRATAVIRKASPNATIYTWSDMFCPEQNAWATGEEGVKNFYLVHGNWAGSWDGLPKDVTVMNWVGGAKGVKFFADRGNSQILCGYYDARDTAGMKRNITAWTKDSAGVNNILGFMYTQWGTGYNNMKEYFNLLNTYDQWSKAAN